MIQPIRHSRKPSSPRLPGCALFGKLTGTLILTAVLSSCASSPNFPEESWTLIETANSTWIYGCAEEVCGDPVVKLITTRAEIQNIQLPDPWQYASVGQFLGYESVTSLSVDDFQPEDIPPRNVSENMKRMTARGEYQIFHGMSYEADSPYGYVMAQALSPSGLKALAAIQDIRRQAHRQLR